MSRTISKPVCSYCNKKFPIDREIYEAEDGLFYCSIECILQAKGFHKVRWSEKYTEIDDSISSCFNCKWFINGECLTENIIKDLGWSKCTCKFYKGRKSM